MYICKQCGKEFTEKYSKWSDGNFCCKECARSYSTKNKRQEINTNVCHKLFEYHKSRYYQKPKKCPVCGNIIPYEKRKQTTCSQQCGHIIGTLTKHNKGSNLGGGYRLNGHRKSYKGYYKGIYCDSTYELAYLIYCLDHNINIKRCTEVFEYEYNGKKHKYHPDFVVEEELVEIKGYRTEVVDIKLESFNKPIKILYYSDLINMFNYVAIAYGKKYNKHRNNFYELYD